VDPGADPGKVAEAELGPTTEGTTSPATVALRIGKLEARNASLNGENTQIPALKSDIDLMSDNARLSALTRNNAASIA
jgi:hypothetical protein